ncbi:ATP-binding protein [Melioribacter sp. OK-6-Me]|uniref:ATP-binding protein n=1 Tax=unclassified Melioribacter TaxID=2627329 RepID=UPI003ED93376
MTEKICYKEIPSDRSLLPALDEFIIGVAKDAGLSEDKFNNLSLSFSEAVSNSIIHGNKNDPDKRIRITVKVDDSKMIIIIKDQGKGFNLDSIPDPTKPENLLKESGRGIHIIKSFVDELRYNFTSEGTETILVLNLK